MSNRQLVGLLGCAFLFFGVFMPFVKIPIMGDINYFQNGEGDGVFILVFTVGSFILIMAQQYRGLWITSFASAGILAFTFFGLQSKLSKIQAMYLVQLQWGWAVIVVGIILLMLAAGMKESATKREIPPAS